MSRAFGLTPRRISHISSSNPVSPAGLRTFKFDQPDQSNASPKKSGFEDCHNKGRDPLPPRFADQIIENEMELQLESVSISIVNKLVELYSMGMVFYEPDTKHKYKFQYFLNKLQDLMLKPNVKESMMQELSQDKDSEDDKEMRRMRLESQVNRVNSEKEAYTLVQSHEDKAKEIQRVLDGDLTNQKDRMKKKLAERKAKSKSKAPSIVGSDENSSNTDEAAQDLDKDLEGLAHLNKNGLNDIKEVDETRCTTPPRRRNKEGVMVFYKNQKPIGPEVKASRQRGNSAVTSVNREEIMASLTNRNKRALSFEKNDVISGAKLIEALQNTQNESNKIEEEEEPEELKEMKRRHQDENKALVEQIREKYRKKRQFMEEDIDEEDKAGIMWERIMNRFEESKEEEIKAELEKLSAKQQEELESYKLESQ